MLVIYSHKEGNEVFVMTLEEEAWVLEQFNDRNFQKEFFRHERNSFMQFKANTEDKGKIILSDSQ